MKKQNTISLFLLLAFSGLQALAQQADSLKQSKTFWLLKFNPATLARGDAEFSIERQRYLKQSFELSAGITFRNMFFENLQPRLFNEAYTAASPRQFKAGYSAKLAYRTFFYSKENFGFYISPQVAYLRYNYRFPLQNIDPANTGFQKEKITYAEIRGLLGFQQYFMQQRAVLDIYLGGGLKHRSIDFAEEQSYYDDFGVYQRAYGSYTTKRNLLGIYGGVKIGWRLYAQY